jgi:hypothetical protein
MINWTHIVGFPRGGTSWIKKIIGSHPDVVTPNGETVILRNWNFSVNIKEVLQDEFPDTFSSGKMMLTKAPLDAKHLDIWQLYCSAANIVFMVRDPRDSVASHHFGTKPWMNAGANANPASVMSKLKTYWTYAAPYMRCRRFNMVKYEDLHIAPFVTIQNLFSNLGLDNSNSIVNSCLQSADFERQTKRRPGVEKPDAHLRKGVMGDHARMDYDFTKHADFIRECGYEV